MGNLFLSFTIAVFASVGLVAASRTFDLEFYTSRTLPLVPILYAVIYEFLDHRKRSRAKNLPRSTDREDPQGTKSETAVIEQQTFGRVVTGVGISFVSKFSLEMFLVALFLRVSGQSFSEVYGTISIETVGRFLRGEHPWFSGSEGVYMLALIALITCFITGLWIGYTSNGKAILEGVFVGAAVMVVMSMTNMLILYRKIEVVTVQLADSMGYVLQAGFLVVIAVQVLLYGFWSGLVQMSKEERLKQKAGKNYKRK
jgi:hypothetical protein